MNNNFYGDFGHNIQVNRDYGPIGSKASTSVSTTIVNEGDRVYDSVYHDYYVLERFLGKGGFAECFSAMNYTRQDKMALKMVERAKLKDGSAAKLQREINIHRICEHKNIARLYYSFADDVRIYLVLELCHHQNLLTLINNSVSGLSENKCRFFMEGLLKAVIYLFDRDILHRDLKPGNILIGLDGQVKLADFGLAIKKQDVCLSSVSGTPNYLAPEVLEKRGHSERSEVWSVGCVLFCMLTGRPPFETEKLDDTYERIRKVQYAFPAAWQGTQEAVDLVEKCLSRDPYIRPSMRDILRDRFMLDCFVNDDSGRSLYRAKSENQLAVSGIPGAVSRQQRATRTKSTFDLKNIENAMYVPTSTIGQQQQAQNGSQHRLYDKSRRRSIIGSQDSGFGGSETDMSRRPALQQALSKITWDVQGLFQQPQDCQMPGAPGSILVRSHYGPPFYVAKWVDYTNRRGFACILSDGSMVVLFNEGTCFAWTENKEQIYHSVSHYAPVKNISTVEAFTDEYLTQMMDIASNYRTYMDKELAGVALNNSDSRSKVAYHQTVPPFLIHAHMGPNSDYVALFLSDSTVQINMLKQRRKVVFWRDRDTPQRYTGVAVLDRGGARYFRVIDRSLIDYYRKEELYQDFQDFSNVIHEASVALQQSSGSLPSGRKPIHSTEC